MPERCVVTNQSYTGGGGATRIYDSAVPFPADKRTDARVMKTTWEVKSYESNLYEKRNITRKHGEWVRYLPTGATAWKRSHARESIGAVSKRWRLAVRG